MQVSSGSRYWPAHIAAAAITARLQVRSVIKKISRKTGSDAGVDFPSGKKFSGKQQRYKQHHAQGFFCPQAESCEEQHNTDGGEG